VVTESVDSASVPRIGLDGIRKVVLAPARGAALLERFRLARAAVRDPWLERDDPYHPRKFSDLGRREPELVGMPPDAA
jgi:nitrite reductase [NAD(P)H] large subunit